MDLTDFVNQWSDSRVGLPLESAGPHCQRLYQRVRDKDKARSLIATKFWQSFFGSIAILKVAGELEIDFRGLLSSQKIVVYRPSTDRFDLLVLVNGPSRIISKEVSLTPDEALDGWDIWNRGMISRFSDFNNPGLALEPLHLGQPFSFVVAPAPQTDLLYAPSPSCKVDPGTGQFSSAGIVVKDQSGRLGVTAALHAVGTVKNVTVDGQSGTVVATDVISDSCFIELSNLPTAGTKGSKGPLSGLLPRGNQGESFDGVASSLTKTVVTGWSLELPEIQRYNQLKVYTKKDTDPGDSGAALITDDDYIAGFAFERSQSGAPIEFASWIWADLVSQALQLEFP